MNRRREFHLVADISSSDPARLLPVLERLLTARIVSTSDGFHVEGDVAGEHARDLNRERLSALRRVERRTRLRATWISGGSTERFFDCVPKGRRPASDQSP
jgi:hypothetical protein